MKLLQHRISIIGCNQSVHVRAIDENKQRLSLPFVAHVLLHGDGQYAPEILSHLYHPIVTGEADAVFGSRFMGGQPHRVLFFWHMAGNRFLTLLSNIFTNLNLTDLETGYKAFKAPVIKSIQIEEDRFGVEPEITAKLARMGCRIYEVGISYSGRTYAEGKKINWKDGVRAIYAIMKYNLQRHHGIEPR